MRLLITGGTGTVGQILIDKFYHHQIIILSRDEYKQSLLLQKYPKIKCLLGDIRDYDTVERACRNVDVVIHAAALKRIETIEDNPIEGVNTNILGSINILRACQRQNVKKVIFISTDKANNPNSMYGASKLCSDKVCLNFNSEDMLCSVIRFGNIFGSRGSVVEMFLAQKDKSSFSVTSLESTRTIITFRQLAEFTDYVLSEMKGGEIFIPKIPSIRIVDLAKAINPDCVIKEIGLRPGERKHEVMISNDLAYMTYIQDNCYIIRKYSLPGDIKVDQHFYYGSNENDFLSIEEIRDLLLEIKI